MVLTPSFEAAAILGWAPENIETINCIYSATSVETLNNRSQGQISSTLRVSFVPCARLRKCVLVFALRTCIFWSAWSRQLWNSISFLFPFLVHFIIFVSLVLLVFLLAAILLLRLAFKDAIAAIPLVPFWRFWAWHLDKQFGHCTTLPKALIPSWQGSFSTFLLNRLSSLR